MSSISRNIIEVPSDKIEGIDRMFGHQMKIDTDNVPKKFKRYYDKTRLDSYKNFKLKSLYQSFNVEEISGGKIRLMNGMVLDSPVLSKAFCNASELLFCIITLIGYEEIDQAEEDMINKLFLDSWGTAYIEMGYVWLKKEISLQLEKEGLYTSHSFSPGQHEVPMDLQKEIFAALAPKEIGVSLNDRFMMHPKKSISGIIGLGSVKNQEGFRPCDICEHRDTCSNAYADQHK